MSNPVTRERNLKTSKLLFNLALQKSKVQLQNNLKTSKLLFNNQQGKEVVKSIEFKNF